MMSLVENEPCSASVCFVSAAGRARSASSFDGAAGLFELLSLVR